MEVFVGKRICENADGDLDFELRVELIVRNQLSRVLHHVAVVLTLGDCVGPDPILSFAAYSVTYFAVEPHATLPTDQALRVNSQSVSVLCGK